MGMTERCIECKKRAVFVKKRQLCKRCYAKMYQYHHRRGEKLLKSYIPIHTSEIEFIRNFFNHKNWLYHPTIFRMNDLRYEPDFYDNEHGVFIEVSATQQAFYANREKYQKFIETFAPLKLEIRRPNGELVDPYVPF